MNFYKNLRFELKKAKELRNSKTSTSSMKRSFENGVFPIYYNTYNLESSFVCVPTDMLGQLLEEIGEEKLANALMRKIKTASEEKNRIADQLRKQYRQKMIAQRL